MGNINKALTIRYVCVLTKKSRYLLFFYPTNRPTDFDDGPKRVPRLVF